MTAGAFGDDVQSGTLRCTGCARSYPIDEGIPRFIDERDLEGPNRWSAGFYDKVAPWYLLVCRLAQGLAKPFGISRQDLVDRLDPAGTILEVSIGPGPMLPYFFARPGVERVVGLDISGGQLDHCRRFARRHSWPVELVMGLGEALPFADDSFDAVFHFGGINFFTGRPSAIQEMIRVAKPGRPVVISDETERGVRLFERVYPPFRRAFGAPREAVQAPTDLVPSETESLRLEYLWHGAIYRLSFRKPVWGGRALATPARRSAKLIRANAGRKIRAKE